MFKKLTLAFTLFVFFFSGMAFAVKPKIGGTLVFGRDGNEYWLCKL